MPTFSSEAVIGGEAAKVLSPQPKRGHRWPINQQPPLGATQINKEGLFLFSCWEDCLRTLKKTLIIHSVIHTYIHTYYIGCICTSWLCRQEKRLFALLRQSEKPHCATKNKHFLVLHKVCPITTMEGVMQVTYLWSTKWVLNS